MANNQENLVSLADRTTDEKREIAIKGGIASGIARKEKATMKKTLEMLLEEKNKKGIQYKELSTLGLIKGACQGKAENYKLMLQLLGELDIQENSDTPTVQINIVDNNSLEKALYEDTNKQ